jgi:type IV pilus assembly protein PilV
VEPAHEKMTGFTMLEVLMSILIVGIGMLALAGMQGRTLKTVREAEQQGVAAMLAAEVADAMRANPMPASMPAVA